MNFQNGSVRATINREMSAIKALMKSPHNWRRWTKNETGSKKNFVELKNALYELQHCHVLYFVPFLFAEERSWTNGDSNVVWVKSMGSFKTIWNHYLNKGFLFESEQCKVARSWHLSDLSRKHSIPEWSVWAVPNFFNFSSSYMKSSSNIAKISNLIDY